MQLVPGIRRTTQIILLGPRLEHGAHNGLDAPAGKVEVAGHAGEKTALKDTVEIAGKVVREDLLLGEIAGTDPGSCDAPSRSGQ
jgi:hypothetical protein